jgi:hypothetical protein
MGEGRVGVNRKGVTTMRKNKKISHEKTTLVFIFTLLALFFVTQAMPSGLSFAQGRVKPEMVLPKGYPDGFDTYGHINRIDKDRVVIDDEPFDLSPETTYNPNESECLEGLLWPGGLCGYPDQCQRRSQIPLVAGVRPFIFSFQPSPKRLMPFHPLPTDPMKWA